MILKGICCSANHKNWSPRKTSYLTSLCVGVCVHTCTDMTKRYLQDLKWRKTLVVLKWLAHGSMSVQFQNRRLLVLESKNIYYIFMVNRPKIHIQHRILRCIENKHLQVHSGGLKFLTLFSKNMENTAERRARPDILISAFLP